MVEMKTKYTVTYERDEDGWWVATAKGLKGCHTQGKTLATARERIREAMGLFIDNASKVDIVDDVKLPPGTQVVVRAAVEALLESRRVAEVTKRVSTKAAKMLEHEGISRRDAAEIMGISHQRVQQIASRSH
jgi:predicted RNase H-like HicB family nuclease